MLAAAPGRPRAVAGAPRQGILSANLDGDVPLKDVARECRLSVSHFSRAFRRTVGVAPHSWLVTRRIEVAKEKLRNRAACRCLMWRLPAASPIKATLPGCSPAWSASVQAPGVVRSTDVKQKKRNAAVQTQPSHTSFVELSLRI